MRYRLRASFQGAEHLNCSMTPWTTHISLESSTVFEGTLREVRKMFPVGDDKRTMTLSIETSGPASGALPFIPIWESGDADRGWKLCGDPRLPVAVKLSEPKKKRSRRRSAVRV